jgi:hypothetical protein
VPLQLYRDRYPELKSLDAHYGPPGEKTLIGNSFKGVPPENNRITRNVCIGKWLDVSWHAKPGMFDVRENFVTTDPAQMAGAGTGFRLPEDSPAWKLGFKAIPFDQIGLRPDADRQRLGRIE